MASLCLVLDLVREGVEQDPSGPELSKERNANLSSLIQSTNDVLEEVVAALEKYEGLGRNPLTIGDKAEKAWKKIRWDQDAVEGFRSRIISNTMFLNTFNSSIMSRASRRGAESLARLNKRVLTLQLNSDQEERLKLLEWLTPLNFTAQQNLFLSRRQQATGHWLLQSTKFQTWMNGPGTTLLCKGMPGAGKTMLACTVVDHLISTLCGGKALVAYIYCDYTRQHEQIHINLIASILKQLLQHEILVPETVWEFYRHHIHLGKPPEAQEMYDLLQSSLSDLPQVYIVVDAVDELSVNDQVRQTLLSSLVLLQKAHSINLLVTSRFIPHITQELRDPPSLIIRARNNDVRKYVRGHFSDLANCVLKNFQLQNIIEDSIASAVDGMFLLARLHMDILGDKTNAKAIKTCLANLPKGSGALDAAYKQAMQRIEEQKPGFSALAKRTLSWIMYAYEPLTVTQLRYALATEAGESAIDDDNLDDIEDVISVCCGLVIIDPETDIVRFVHYTTREFFDKFGSQYFHNALEEIAVTCLTYILFIEFGKGWVRNFQIYKCNDRYREAHEMKYAFLQYAARFWARHAQSCLTTFEGKVGRLLVEFLTDGDKVSNVGHIQIREGFYTWTGFPTGDDSCTLCSGLHLATYSNFAGLILYVLEAGLFVPDLKDAFGRTPLMWAAFEGHEATVKALIRRKDVNVNSLVYDGTGYLTALGYAAIGGHAGTVELLLERNDIDINLIGNPKSFTPLVYAAAMGNEAVVKVLLKHPDLAADCHLLQRSAAQYRVRIVDLHARGGYVELLDHTHQDEPGRPPMGVAAITGRIDVAKLLLEYGSFTVEDACARSRGHFHGCPKAARLTAIFDLLVPHCRTRSNTG